jgi:hypothetical protein
VRLYLRGLATGAVVLSWLTLAGQTTSAGDEEKYVILGHGVSSCATFRSDVKDGHKNSYIAWLLGYLTANNEARKGASNILAHTDAKGAFAWIEEYCRSHPTEEYFEAVRALIRFLAPETRSLPDNAVAKKEDEGSVRKQWEVVASEPLGGPSNNPPVCPPRDDFDSANRWVHSRFQLQQPY